MRPLTVNTFVTLDGVMQAPGGPEEDPTSGFDHGGWAVGYWDDSIGAKMAEYTGRPYDLLLGRKTYEIFAAHWPTVEPPDDLGLNAARKYVASRTLESVDWNNSTLLKGDVAEAVAKLKEEEGPEIQVHGSSSLLQTLLENDLVDELNIKIFPVVLGTGKRLFADGAIPAGLTLTDSATSSTGVVMVTYTRGGDIKYGSFAREEPTEKEKARRAALEES